MMATPDTEFFEVKPIAPDASGSHGWHGVPKCFSKTMTHCLPRKKTVDNILERLEAAALNQSVPGVYLSGPAGVGKSVIAYMIAQICKFEKSWMTIYIPECRSWCREDPTVAKGFFLDRVLDALHTQELQKEYFPQIYDRLTRPPDLGVQLPEGGAWALVGELKDEEEVVQGLYDDVVAALEESKVKVLLVCDAIGALWDRNKPKRCGEPWNLANFEPKFLRRGALLLTGAFDNDFVVELPNGIEKYEYPLGNLSRDEVDSIKSLPGCAILRKIEELDVDLWYRIVDGAGNMPRELCDYYIWEANKFKLEDRLDKLQRMDALDPAKEATEQAIHEDVMKSIKNWRDFNENRHYNGLVRASWGYLGDPAAFNHELFKACKEIFLPGQPAPAAIEVLRTGSFLVTPEGTMYPTTLDAQKVYFAWFSRAAGI